MTITVSTTDPRSIKALAVLETAPEWLKIRRKGDGARFYVVPGSDGRVYWTNTRECSCPDATRRGVPCKHILAVRLHVARVLATRQGRAARERQARDAAAFAELYGSDGDGSPAYRHPASCPCDSCWDAADERDGTHTERTERRGRVPLVGRLLA